MKGKMTNDACKKVLVSNKDHARLYCIDLQQLNVKNTLGKRYSLQKYTK